MTLLKNTILITLLLLFSFELSRCQGTGFLSESATVSEETPIEEVFPPDTQVDYAEEETREQTTTTTVETPLYEGEATTTETSPAKNVETVIVDEQEQEDAGEEENREETTTEETNSGETDQGTDPEEESEVFLGCPQYIEETEVDGYWMTFHPCCVLPIAQCDDTYEPVCIERVQCEGDHCRWHYETVVNLCNACRGHDDWHYSKGKCPWEGSDKI